MDSIKKVKEIEKEKNELIVRLQSDGSNMRKIIDTLEDQLQRYKNHDQTSDIKQELKHEIKQMKNLILEKDQ